MMSKTANEFDLVFLLLKNREMDIIKIEKLIYLLTETKEFKKFKTAFGFDKTELGYLSFVPFDMLNLFESWGLITEFELTEKSSEQNLYFRIMNDELIEKCPTDGPLVNYSLTEFGKTRIDEIESSFLRKELRTLNKIRSKWENECNFKLLEFVYNKKLVKNNG